MGLAAEMVSEGCSSHKQNAGIVVNRAVKLYLTMLFMKPPEIVPVKAMEQPEADSFVISVV